MWLYMTFVGSSWIFPFPLPVVGSCLPPKKRQGNHKSLELDHDDLNRWFMDVAGQLIRSEKKQHHWIPLDQWINVL